MAKNDQRVANHDLCTHKLKRLFYRSRTSNKRWTLISIQKDACSQSPTMLTINDSHVIEYNKNVMRGIQ